MAKFYPISYSTLKLYENCPYSFYRQKIMEPRVKDDKKSPALLRGQEVHKVLEDFVRKGSPIPKEHSNLTAIAGAIDVISKVRGVSIEAERSIYIDSTGKSLHYPKFFDNFQNSYMNAKLDLTVVIGDKALIKDYKTGKSEGDKFQLDIQAACVFLDDSSINLIKSQFIYVDTGNYSPEYTHTRDSIWTDEMVERMTDYQYGLENDKFAQNPDPRVCRFCPVVDCPHNQNTFKKRSDK